MKTINDLNIGDLATDNYEYSTVQMCVHGHFYYAYTGDAIDAERYGHDVNDAVKVSDMFDDKVSHCCG